MKDILFKNRHEQIIREYSGVEVYYLPDLAAYLKIGRIDKNSHLTWERDALQWLSGKIAVPVVLDFEYSGGIESILISEIAGTPASDRMSEPSPELTEKFMIAAARSMRLLHTIATDACPLDQRLDAKFIAALKNIRNGFVDESDFDKERLGKTAAEIYTELLADRPSGEDLVFTHGDMCLPNMIVANGGIAGFIDLDRAGVADRYQDIALFLRSFRFNAAAAIDIEPIFCEAYGIAEIDRAKLDFYTKLDELF